MKSSLSSGRKRGPARGGRVSDKVIAVSYARRVATVAPFINCDVGYYGLWIQDSQPRLAASKG
ncbi:hypothetical protein MTOK_34680 [Mycolicibacterium tokaiense]|nr:hypothetical protein MTOK_34680 [Mycolicibacterium tokaiense]